MISDDDFKKIVNDVLSWDLAVFQRKVAIRRGVRECSELWQGCSHGNWCYCKSVCLDCGIAKSDMMKLPPEI